MLKWHRRMIRAMGRHQDIMHGYACCPTSAVSAVGLQTPRSCMPSQSPRLGRTRRPRHRPTHSFRRLLRTRRLHKGQTASWYVALTPSVNASVSVDIAQQLRPIFDFEFFMCVNMANVIMHATYTHNDLCSFRFWYVCIYKVMFTVTCTFTDAYDSRWW